MMNILYYTAIVASVLSIVFLTLQGIDDCRKRCVDIISLKWIIIVAVICTTTTVGLYIANNRANKPDATKELPFGQPPYPGAQVRITSSFKDTTVPEQITVNGTLTSIDAKIWLVVHPMGISVYWVQSAINLKDGGAWSGTAIIGSPDDTNKTFEIMAVVNPRDRLTEGDTLSSWPDADWNSKVITVTRGS